MHRLMQALLAAVTFVAMATVAEITEAIKRNRAARRSLRQRFNARVEQAKRLQRRLALAQNRRGLPSWLPDRHAERWRKPWTANARDNADFRKTLWANGYLSPNFTRREGGSKDGTPIPDALRSNAQAHAFRLEIVRHRLGDKAMRPLSWYRSPAHNARVGGASRSQHLQANATDWSDVERVRLGSSAFNAAMRDVFKSGGIGTWQGHVRHVDDGPERTWVY